MGMWKASNFMGVNTDTDTDEKILKQSLIKIKKSKEYSFNDVKLLFIQNESTNRETFKIFSQDSQVILTASEAKTIANLIQDIYKENE